MWRVRGYELKPTLTMGIVNVTPDSFSDGGQFLDADAAVEHGRRLLAEGARILDVGGESTRPGADAVPLDEELARIMPVVERLVSEGALVSVDTSKAEVAEAALAAGAVIVNDVTSLGDPAMADVISKYEAGLILMHMQGSPRTMQVDPHYEDVVAEVRTFLLRRADDAKAAGIAPESIAIDPGIGFGKNLDHNLALLRNLDALVGTGYPVVLGTSRKSFLGKLTGRLPEDRDVATAATVALGVAAGVFAVRVHNAGVAEDARRVAEAIVHA